MTMIVNFLQMLAIGIAVGAGYALLALAINTIYATSNILNFAMGELMMLGGMAGWFFITELKMPYIVGFLCAAATVSAVTAIEYVLVVWPLVRRQAAVISIVVATLGFSVVVKIATSMLFGKVERYAEPPLGQGGINVFGVIILSQYIVIILVTAITVILLAALYTRTTVGTALRAAATEPDGARLMGINVSAVVFATFALGGFLAGVAGLVLTPLSYASPWVGLEYAILGFAAAIIGGLGSFPGSVAGGLTIGLAQVLVVRYISADWGDFITFTLLLLVLYARPSGLFRELQAAATWSR
jgi:branched-chain amino acid transport system permease protein